MTPLTTLALCLAPFAAQDQEGSPGGVRVVVTPPTQKQVEVEVHDVRSLTGHDLLRELETVLIGTTGLGDPKALQEQVDLLESKRKEAAASATALAAALSTYMEPKFDPEHDQVLDLGQGSLVVVASQPKQAWVRTFLERQAGHEDYVMLQAHMFTAPAGTFVRLGIERSGMLLDTEQKRELLEKALRHPEVEVVTAPQLVTRPLQKAEMTVLNQVAYVRDWKIEVVQPGDVTLADPQVDVLQEGIVMNMRAASLADDLYGIEFEMSVSKIERPIATRSFKLLPNSTPVTVSEPVVQKVELGSTLRIAPGTTAAFIAHDTEEGSDVLVTLQLDVVDPAELAPPVAPRKEPLEEPSGDPPAIRRRR